MEITSLRVTLLALLLGCLAVVALAQRDASKPLTNADIISMVKEGLHDDAIIRAIDGQASEFVLTDAGKRALQKYGASAKVIAAMVAASHRQQSTSPSRVAGTTPASTSGATEQTPQALRDDEARDPRLKQMSAEDRQYILDQGAQGLAYCNTNGTLMNFYDCACFSKKVVDARIASLRAAGRSEPEPLTNLVFSLKYSECAAPAKIDRYGRERTYEILKMDTKISPAQLERISGCVGPRLSSAFLAQRIPNIAAINGMFQSELTACRQQVLAQGAGG